MPHPHRPLPCLALAAALLALAPDRGHAQKADKPTSGDAMIYQYLCAETDKLSQKFLDGARTIDEWQKKRPRLYQEYMDMLGLWPIPDKTPLQATITGSLVHEGVVIDKLHYQSKPGLYVTANLYRPKSNNIKPGDRRTVRRLPTILYVCGHSNKGRDGNKTAFQDHGMWFASNGYNCLIVDTLQLGEIPGVHHGTYGRPWLHLKAYGIKDKDQVENRWWWHAAGYTPAGVEAWNGVRGIDYLLTRPDVDADKIGVTGISGGGAATFWIAAADDRVKVAVPVSGMSDLESYVKNKVINGHCDCMFLYNTYQWDWTTIAALVAPRPLLFANSDDDKIFPMDGNRRVMDKLRTIYKMYGKPELTDEYVSKGGHAYRPDLRVAIFKFINKHLKGDATTPAKDAEFKAIDGKLLRVFATDDDIPKDAINARIDETFVPRAKVETPAEGKFAGWKRTTLHRLTTHSFQDFSARVSPPKLLVPARAAPRVGFETTSGRIIEVLFMVETPKRPVTFLLTEDHFQDYFAKDLPPRLESLLGIKKLNEESIEKLVKEQGLVWFNPSSMMEYWSRKSPPNYVERSHVLLGDTVDREKLKDLLSFVALVKGAKKTEYPVKIIASKQAGILAAYAALFEPSIKEVVIIDPPVSHREGPYFLNVLRVCDIPEALGLLAPQVKLTLIGAKDAAFDRTAAIYKAAGAADKFVRK